MIKIVNYRRIVFLIDAFIRLIYKSAVSLGIWKIPPKELSKVNPRSILIIELEPIGDVVLSTFVYAELKNKYPNAQVSVMVGSWASEIISNNPYIDEVFINDVPWAFSEPVFSIRGFFGHLRYFLTSYLKVYNKIKRGNYDLGIDLRGDLRNIIFFLFLPAIKTTISFDRSGGDCLLTKAVNFDSSEHIVSKNKRLLAELEIIDNNRDRVLVFPSEADFLRVKLILERHGVLEDDDFCILHPGAGRCVRFWDTERYAALADFIIETLNLKVILTGSFKDRELSNRIVAHSKNKLVDLSGRLSLMELAAVLKKCRLLICPDTGVMHMASAFLTPTIALFGPDRPEHTKPLNRNLRIVDKEFACSPCLQRRCRFIKNGYSGCMNAITVEDIKKEIIELLGTKVD